MIEEPQRESGLRPEDPPWRVGRPSDESSAAWRLAWALVGVLAYAGARHVLGF